MTTSSPQALSISEIRNYMLENDCKVTNHALVKHFKRFLTSGNSEAQSEARKQFKTFVNILSTIKNENNQKYLILRKKYVNECPTEETIQRALLAPTSSSLSTESSVLNSPGGNSIGFDNNSSGNLASPMSTSRQPPPYKAPPEVVSSKSTGAALNRATVQQPLATGIAVKQENVETYGEVVQEFSAALKGLGRGNQAETTKEEHTKKRNPKEEQRTITDGNELRGKSISRTNSIDEANNNNNENIPRFSFSSGASGTSTLSAESATADKLSASDAENNNPISVKEATRKFNRMASEEEAKILSPPTKKKPENALTETKEETPVPVSYNHPKAKEWIVSMAKANYQELAKLALEYPELVRLTDPATGYTALHWAAKHGNEDVVKLIAGKHKADVNARTNGGYTPLHIAVQFGRDDIFELLYNGYKANCDITDWSGNNPLDYRQKRTSVSTSTYKKIKARRKHAVERDLSFLRIGSLNVRVKKTTEAFSNFLGVGGASTIPLAASHQHSRRNHHLHAMKTLSQPPPLSETNASSNNKAANVRASVPVKSNEFVDNVHKTWGSADNLPMPPSSSSLNGNDDDDAAMMPPPKNADAIKKRQKSGKRGSVASSCATDSPRHSISSSNSSSNLNSGYSSMPTTPNQLRSPLRTVGDDDSTNNVDSDSDSACGFGSHWSVGGGGGGGEVKTENTYRKASK